MPKTYYIFKNGRIKRESNTIHIISGKNERKIIPVENIQEIYLFGEIDLNTKFLNFISQAGIPLHIFNYYGFYSGTYYPRERNVSGFLIIKQVQHYLENDKRLKLAKKFVESAIFHMLRNLKNYKEKEGIKKTIYEIEKINNLDAESTQQLMGTEGNIREKYYRAFESILNGKLMFKKRTKQPPQNPINALISFGNSMMYTTTLSEIYHTQLCPTISWLHEPSSKRFSLSLDIAEIFKPLIVDPIIFSVVNKEMIKINDFEEKIGYCYLKESGRKIFVREFDNKLSTTIKHRELKRSVSYRQLIRIELYKVIKHLIGDEEYKPLRAWW